MSQKIYNKTTKRYIKAFKGNTNLINLAFTRAVKRGDQFTNLPKNIAIDIKKKKPIKIFTERGKFTKLFRDAIKSKGNLTNTGVQYSKSMNPNVFIDTKSKVPLKDPYVKTGKRKGQVKKQYQKLLQNKKIDKETKVVESTSQAQAKLNTITQNKLKKNKAGVKQLQGTRFYKQYRVNIKDNDSYENIYMEAMDFKKKNKWGNINLILYFKDNSSNKVQPFVVHQDNLKSFEDFTNYVQAVRNGQQVVSGSDQYFTDEYTPILNYFDIGLMKIATAGGNGKADKLLYKNCDINGDGKCGFLMLQKIVGVDKLKKYMYENNKKERSFYYWSAIKECIEFFKIPVQLYYNSIKFADDDTEYEIFNRDAEESKDKYGRKMLMYKLKNEDVTPVYGESFNYDRNDEGDMDIKPFKIIFDVSNSHFDLMTENTELIDNLYMGSNGIYKKEDDDFKLVMSYSFVNRNNESSQLRNRRYLIFDYETIIDFNANSCMKEFACSWLDVSEEDLNDLDLVESGKHKKIKSADEWYQKNSCVVDEFQDFEDLLDETCGENDNEDRKKVFNCISYDCSKFITDYICYNQTEHDVRYILIGFNNANFDNYILADHILERHHNVSADDEWQPKMDTKSIMYNGSELLRFKINGCHEVFDIRKHIVGSLKGCCKDFKIDKFKKQDCDDYDLWTELHDKKCLMEEIKTDKSLIKYNDYDVISTGLVFYRYKQALKNLPCANDLELTDFSTMGMVIWKIAQDYWKDEKKWKYNKIDFPLLSWEQYQTLQQNKIAGRVEMFNGVQKFLGDMMMSLDVCSLYPFVCCVYNKAWYPHGKIITDDNLNIKSQTAFEKFMTTNDYTEAKPNFEEYYSFYELLKMMGYDEQSLSGSYKTFAYKIAQCIESDEYESVGFTYEQISKNIRNYKISSDEVWGKFKEEVLSWKIIDIKKRVKPIAFFKCDVDQSNLKKDNLPLIYASKKKDKNGNCIENMWGHNDYIIQEDGSKRYAWDLKDVTLSNVIIQQMFKFGCKVHIKSGFHFTRKERGIDMFGFIKDMMEAKNEQDTYKAKKDWDNYNQALRTTLKLLQNAISGRVIMGLHPQQKKLVTSEEELHKLHEKEQKGKIKNLSAIKPLGNSLFVQYEKNEEDLIKKQKPIYLGVLIYDYAKTYMYEHTYSKIGLDKLSYTDTDAVKGRGKFLQKYIDEYASMIPIPAWKELNINHPLYKHGSKKYGSLENEFEEEEFCDELKCSVEDIQDRYFCLVQKKSYMYSIKVNGKWQINKDWFRFKGVNPNSILLDPKKLPDFIHKKYTNKDKPNETYKFCLKSDYEDDAILQRKMFEFYKNKKGKSVLENAIKFFDQIHINKSSIVLAQSFRKITRNNKVVDVTDVDDDKCETNFNKVQVAYCVKNIKI